MATEYRFNVGDSTDGPIGIAFSITAESREAAVKLLRDALPEQFSLGNHGDAVDVMVYTNVDKITESDVADEVRDHWTCDGCDQDIPNDASYFYRQSTDTYVCRACHEKES